MPIYEYKGLKFDIATEDPNEAKQKILAYQRGVAAGPLESDFSGALEAGFLNRALGLSRALGGDAGESQIKSQKAAEEAAKTNPLAVGIGGFGVDTIAAIPGLVAAHPLAAGGKVAYTFLAGALGGGPAGAGRGGERYQEILTKTGDEDLANQAALASSLTGPVDVGAPAAFGGKIITRALGGLGLNVGLGEADVAAQNAILSDHPELQRAQFDPTNMAINGLFGTAMGALSPARPFARIDTPNVKPTEKQVDEEFKFPSEAEASQAVITGNQNRIDAIDKQIGQVTDDLVKDITTLGSIQENVARNGGAATEKQQNAIARIEESIQKKTEARDRLLTEKNDLAKSVESELAAVQRREPIQEEVPTQQTLPLEDPIAAQRTPMEEVGAGGTAPVPDTGMVPAKTPFELELDGILASIEEASAARRASPDSEPTLYSRVMELPEASFAHMIRNITGSDGSLLAMREGKDLADPELRSLILSESIQTAKRQHNARPDVQASPRALEVTDPRLVTALEGEGTAGGLKYVADTMPNSPVGIVAREIMDNQKVRPDVTLVDDLGGNAGVYNSLTNTTTLGRGGKNAVTFVHETAHGAVTKAVAWAKDDLLKRRLPVTSRVAVKNLNDLYTSLKNKIPESFANARKDLDEFISEGLTDRYFQKWLADQKYQNTTALSKLAQAISNILGLSSRGHNALTELLNNSQVLIRNSDGTPTTGVNRSKLFQPLDPDYDLSKPVDTLALVEKIKSGTLPAIRGMPFKRIGINMFGDMQWVQGIMKQAPFIRAIYSEINNITREAIRLERDFLHNISETLRVKDPKGILSYNKLNVYDNENSVAHQITKITNQDAAVLHDLFIRGEREKLSYEEVLSNYGKDLTANQRKMWEVSVEMFRKMANKAGIKRPKDNWYPAIRQGGFAVGVRTRAGNIFHLETFRTKAEADMFKQRVGDQFITDDILDKSTTESLADSFSSITEALSKRGNDVEALQVADQLEKIRQEMALKAGLGSHDKHRSGISGYSGSQWFKSRDQLGSDFRQAILDSAHEYSTLWKKREITRQTDALLNDPDIQTAIPDQVELARFLRDYAINNHKKYGFATELNKGLTKYIEEPYVDLIYKVNKRFGTSIVVPKYSIIERTHGVAAQLFYISVLTTRPAFWAAQVLSSPFALRGLLRDGSLLETTVASGKGMMDVLTGGDLEFRQFVMRMANEGNSLHPQFVNDINSIGKQFFGDARHATLKRVFEIGTGQAPASMSDAISRYITSAIGYEFYKNKGLSGDALLRRVEEFSDATMVMYSRQHSSPMFDRAGLVGEATAPLQKYAIAQLGNFINDIKYIAEAKGGKAKLAATLPAISTLMVTMIQGGVFGGIMVAEYEMLRWAAAMIMDLLEMGEDFEEYFPPMEKAILENTSIATRFLSQGYEMMGMEEETALTAAQYGIVSALTGFDVGSGLRSQPYIGNGLSNFEKGPLDSVPVVNFAHQLLSNVGTAIKADLGKATEAEERKAYMQFQPFIGYKYLMDKYKFDSGERDMVRDSSRGFGEVEQTTKEEMSTLLGSRSMERTKLRSVYQARTEEKQKQDRLTKQIDLFVDALEKERDFDTTRLETLAADLGIEGKSLNKRIENTIKNRNMTLLDRFIPDNSKRSQNRAERLYDVEE